MDPGTDQGVTRAREAARGATLRASTNKEFADEHDQGGGPTVAIPLEWPDVEAVADSSSDPAGLLLVTDEVLSQIDARSALAEPC